MTITKEGPPQGLDLPVLSTDFDILAKARKILAQGVRWNRNDDRLCEDDARQRSWSLFCALYQASIDVSGVYLHRRPVLMEVRAVVGETTNRRQFEHILRDYNNLESTTFPEIVRVLDGTLRRLQARSACRRQNTYSRSISEPYPLPIPNEATLSNRQEVVFWGEGLSRTVQNKAYALFMGLGSEAQISKAPNAWLAASSSVTRRTWKYGETENTDIIGKLPNGNSWRYFSQCGGTARYYDVPLEASAFFDAVIKSAYLEGSRK